MTFVSDSEKEEIRLKELKSWLINCKYPIPIINRGSHNPKLQGPAPDPKKETKILPLVSTQYIIIKHFTYNILLKSFIIIIIRLTCQFHLNWVARLLCLF